jgi:hypothetical protein
MLRQFHSRVEELLEQGPFKTYCKKEDPEIIKNSILHHEEGVDHDLEHLAGARLIS